MRNFSLIYFCVSFFVFSAFAKTLKRVECDDLEKNSSRFEDGMIERDIEVKKWAQCWEDSLNRDLDMRLLALKKTDVTQFKVEMALQKTFNIALKEMCSRACDYGGGSGMKGISYNFCRVEGYRYRTAQALQIQQNLLSIPVTQSFGANKSRNKAKQTKYFTDFIKKLCNLQSILWKDAKVPINCELKAKEELDGLALTDDVCDLS